MIIKNEFTPAPDGIHNAVCVDEIDLGIVDGQFGPKHKVKIVWEIEAKMEDGKRFIVSKRYNVSMHEKSSLAKDLKTWRGRAFSAEEMKGFDLEKIIGAPCQLVVTQTESEGAIYANVTTVIKAGATKLKPAGTYVRVKDRPDYKPPTTHAAKGSNGHADYDDDGREYEPEYSGENDIPF